MMILPFGKCSFPVEDFQTSQRPHMINLERGKGRAQGSVPQERAQSWHAEGEEKDCKSIQGIIQ